MYIRTSLAQASLHSVSWRNRTSGAQYYKEMFRPTKALSNRIRTARTACGLFVASRPIEAQAAFIEAWQDLSLRSQVENLFYEPDFTLAGRDAFGAKLDLLMVGDRSPEESGLRLLAVWPFQIRYRWGLPLPTLVGWSHGTSVFGVPLIDKNDPTRALTALLEAPEILGLPCRFLMPYIPLDVWSRHLMERAESEAAGLSCPGFADGLEGREAA